MAVTLTIAGTNYLWPEAGETGFADETLALVTALCTDLLQKSGGLFTLTSEVDFGATYGVKSAYFKSRASNPASSGAIRLGASDGLYFRNPSNTGNYGLTMDGSGNILWRGTIVPTYSDLTAANVANVPSGNLTATNVQDALYELQGDIDGYAAAVKTFTNKSISGATNTFSLIPTTALANASVTADPDAIVVRDATGSAFVNDLIVDGSLSVANQISSAEIFGSDVEASTSMFSPFFASTAASIATTGVVRLANTQSLAWRNAANSANKTLSVNASDVLTYNGAVSFGAGSFTNITSTVQATLNTMSATYGLFTNLDVTGILDASAASVSAASLVSNSLSANSGQKLLLSGGEPDGASAIGVEFRNTAASYATFGAKSFRWTTNNGTFENGYVDKDNQFRWSGNVVASNLIAGNLFANSTSAPVGLIGSVNNGATAIGTRIENSTALTSAGANITAFYNANVEKLAIDKDGNFDFLNGTASIKYVSASTQFLIDRSVSITNGPGNATMYSDYAEVTNDLNVYGQGYIAFGLATDPSGNVATGTIFSDVYNPNQLKYLTFQSNCAPTDTETDFTLTSTATRTSGKLLQVMNNGVEAFRVTPGGDGYLNNLKIVTETPAFLASIAPKQRVMSLAMESWRAGATAPTTSSFGSAPRKSGWQYTAAGAGTQEMEMFLDVPDDIDVNYPVYIDLGVLLTAAETVGDTCDFQVQYVSTAAPGSLTGTATTATRTLSVQSGKTAAGTMYSVAIQLDPLDATNPLNTPDCHVAFSLKRSTAGTVGSVLVLGSCFKYTSKI